MAILTKRWNDPRAARDGFRLLVCRYRPRALPKSEETWDSWDKNLGPSEALHADFHGKNGPPLTWAAFRRRYLAEMKSQTARIDALARRSAAGETICLLCSKQCTDESHCHRSLLRGLIEARGAKM
jgi:uncharacterized protein YeaO (DUF488 family)